MLIKDKYLNKTSPNLATVGLCPFQPYFTSADLAIILTLTVDPLLLS